MNIGDFHIVKGDINAIFHPPSFTLIEINDMVCDIITRIKNNEKIETIAVDFKVKTTDIENLIVNLSNAIPNKPDHEELLIKKERRINRITLHVANDCNLRCSYCYANGGDYKLPKSKMTIDTAAKFVDFCITHFDKIGNIVFFGGEPLLNPEIIEFICESFDQLHRSNQIKYIPTWGMITNGTIINDSILQLIKRYINFITISVDGPQELNDFNRKFVSGKGSYTKIAEFIRRIKNETNVHLRYEATYTLHHRQKKWSESDVKLFLMNEFDIRGTVTHDISHQENVDVNNSQGTGFPEGFFSILNSMAHKVHKEMCMVGTTIVAISTDGEIYPCHMNNGKKHLSLGNISAENIFNSPDKYMSKFPYLKSLFKIDKPCIDCWANPICGGCAIRWFYNGKSDKYNSFPDSLLCETNKKHIENILLLIVRLRKDKTKWEELLKGINNYDDYDYFR